MFTKSENFKQEYCCTIVRIGKVEPIDNSDFLAQVLVEGRTIVVRKDQVHEGDVMLYVANECQVNADFLRSGSYFDYSGINVPLVAVCNVPPVAQCNVPPQKWLQ